MAALLVIAPVDDARVADCRAFHATLAGDQRAALAEWQRRHDVERVAVFTRDVPTGAEVLWLVEADDPVGRCRAASSSDNGFDQWITSWCRYLHDADLGQLADRSAAEVVTDSAPPTGPLRGWPE